MSETDTPAEPGAVAAPPRSKWKDPIQHHWLDTNLAWIVLSIVLIVAALAAHQTAMATDLYEHPPHPDLRIDVYTHALTSIAMIALLLNLNYGPKRWRYTLFPIVFAIIFGASWEAFEEAVIRLDIFPFYNSGWNALQDMFMDTMGGVFTGFFVDTVIV
jgi:hypothetical protein